MDVEIVPEKIDVDVTIASPSKELPIKIIPKGDVSFGLAISSMNMNETKVTAYGNAEALAKLKYIPVEIDVSNLKENKEYKKELSKPVGVKSLSINNVTITVQGTSETATKVTVNLKGVKSVIDAIKTDDLSAYIDLGGYGEGEYEVDVKVDGNDNKIKYTPKTKKVKIKIVKK